jgi:hypothetical protein
MTDLDILNYNIGGMTVKDATAFTFLQWVANKLNGVKAFSADATELVLQVQNPPMSRFMADENKIIMVRRLERIGVQL